MSSPPEDSDPNSTARETTESGERADSRDLADRPKEVASGRRNKLENDPSSDEIGENGLRKETGASKTGRAVSCEQCSQYFEMNSRIPLNEETAASEAQQDNDFVLCPNCGSLEVGLFSGGQSTQTDPKKNVVFQGKRYEFGRIIGRGSYGVVYAAFDNDLRRNVAIKAARGDLAGKEAELFLREARSASRLRHPNIVTVHDILTTEEGVFIVSDLIVGDSLKVWLDRHDTSRVDCIKLIIKLCRAMDYAHRNGVIHRDLKPGNIMMDQDAEPHVLDFGLSQSIDNSLDTIAQDGVPIGTPAFMAPEQVQGKRNEIDRRSDIFAIGVILFQVLSGRLPFSGNRTELFRQIVTGSPASFPKAAKVPRSLETICFKALAKKPEDRYQWGAEMADDLQRFLEGNIVRAHGGVDRRVISTMTRKYFLALAAVALLVALGIVSYQQYQRYLADNPTTRVVIDTVPAGGQLTWQRYNPKMGTLEEETIQSIGGNEVELLAGFYKVYAKAEDELVEVFRTVPEAGMQQASAQIYNGVTIFLKHRGFTDETIRYSLPDINVIPMNRVNNEMAFIPGGKVSFPQLTDVLPRFSGNSKVLTPFLLATQETTWGDLLEAWPEMILPLGTDQNAPIDQIDWDIAVAYAEVRGRCLPSIFELKHASTNAGTSIYPWGDESPEEMLKLESENPNDTAEIWDKAGFQPPVEALLTGVAEWSEDAFLILTFDADGKLNPVSANNSIIMSVNSAPFPSFWFVVDHQKGKPWKIENSLRQGPFGGQKITAGFRTVRRLSE